MGQSLIAELNRRNVIRACLAYVALGWVVTQVTATVQPMLHLPEWIGPVVLWIGVIGFPFVVMFSWVYELTPEGLKRERDVDRSESITRLTARRLDYAVLVMLAIAIALFVFDRIRPQSRAAVTTQASSQAAAAVSETPATAAIPGIENDPSIAVLPLINMSSDKEQEYFSDGISEELLNLLAQVPKLRVIARTSSFKFKGEKVDIDDVARKLHVASILEGSVRKAGDKVRITVQLIRASDSSHLWSEDYDRQLTDVFKVQDEIAAAVVSQLKVKLLPDQQMTNSHRTANTEAYNQYLLGNQLFNRGTADGYRRAVAAYRQSVALDPGYAAAYAGLAFAEAYASDFAETAAENAAGRQRTTAAADKAVALAPDLADGYVARGGIRSSYTWDWAGAQADFERALMLDPGNGNVQGRYGRLLLAVAKLPDAVAAARKAVELDPLSAGEWNNLGLAYWSSDKLPEARDALNRAIAISPESGTANFNLGALELLEGHVQVGLTLFHRAGEGFRQAGVAMAEHTLGHTKESQQALNELIANYAHDAAAQITMVYAWRGEVDTAFQWLERAYAQHDGGTAMIKTYPLFKSLRTDPRFAAMVKKLGLPP